MNSHKLYALLVAIHPFDFDQLVLPHLDAELANHLDEPSHNKTQFELAIAIAIASDRVNLESANNGLPNTLCHPLSGQQRDFSTNGYAFQHEQLAQTLNNAWSICQQHSEPLKTFYWWVWRCYPQAMSNDQNQLLYPTHNFMPDTPLASHSSTVAALAGALSEYPEGKPHLLIFTFSPVQEFIKASRKFLDFWSGSYLLHYFGAHLCDVIAQEYGPDAMITPSLWGQEIIDTMLLQRYEGEENRAIRELFEQTIRGTEKAGEKGERVGLSLQTAGFPNTLTALVPSATAANQLSQKLTKALNEAWEEIAKNVRKAIKTKTIEFLQNDENFNQLLEQIAKEFGGEFSSISTDPENTYYKELNTYKQHGCWEWNSLWDAQIQNTWETYSASIPLGDPGQESLQSKNNDTEWTTAQNELAAILNPAKHLPSQPEQNLYTKDLNIGTWWGKLQGRLGQSLQILKNTRAWKIAVAPGERSSLSGSQSAVHPRFNYAKFQNGRGMKAGSQGMFWFVLSQVDAFRGVFNGSEKLNALELSKRLAWIDGGVAEKLGVTITQDERDYRSQIRFPNAASIASAYFVANSPKQFIDYVQKLREEIEHTPLSKCLNGDFQTAIHRPFQIIRADTQLKRADGVPKKGLNGVAFSAKWLAEDMGLNKEESQILREAVNNAKKDKGFSQASPEDWWVLVLGDGDSMGQYVTGRRLKKYGEYLLTEYIDGDRNTVDDLCKNVPKRMGPATHVGLNRALLDFSNRLVPYLTEQRHCGRVIYSGGDDVMAVLPLAELPGFLQSLRAAWSGERDPQREFEHKGGYWYPQAPHKMKLPDRPLFTMGNDATMSLGIVIAHKSVPLPTVLEKLWDAEKERAKKLLGHAHQKPSTQETERAQSEQSAPKTFPNKDGLCFRVIYSSGNTLEALMKGDLLEQWCDLVSFCQQQSINHDKDLSPVFHRLAEELPQRANINPTLKLFDKATRVILSRREYLPEQTRESFEEQITNWINAWEDWAYSARCRAASMDPETYKHPEDIPRLKPSELPLALGTQSEDLAALLRFTAFWLSRRHQEKIWN